MKTPRNHTHYWTAGDMTIYYRHTGSQAFIWVDEMWKNMPMSEFEHLEPMMTPVNPVSVESVYVPKVGEECVLAEECSFFSQQRREQTLLDAGTKVIVVSSFKRPDNGNTCITVMTVGQWHLGTATGNPEFMINPLPDPAQQRRDELLKKWRSQSQEHAHDTEKSLVSLGMVFDFISELEGE